MSTKSLRNISIAEFQAFLELSKCNFIGIKAGHEKWFRSDLKRPVIFQTHINPVPEFIIQNNLRTLSYNKKQFFEILEQKVIIIKEKGNIYKLNKVEK